MFQRKDFEGKRVLVTGADGFIGSHLVQALVSQNAQVRALSLYNSFNQKGWLDKIPELDAIEVVFGDVRDMNTCRKIVKGIDLVFHLASLIAIPYSYLAPESYFQTNIMGTANLCQAALDQRVERFLHTSTSEVYGSARFVPIDESHPLQPQSPYSASKIGADSIALSFFYSFSLPVTIVRPFNTYGPRQSARAIIPTLITQIQDGKREIAVGNTAPTRDFTYVADLCESFIRLAQVEEAIGETVNVGTGIEISIQDLALKIGSLFNQEIELIQEKERFRPTLSEVTRLCCNSAKLQKLTSFSPKTPLDEGLQKTIDWFCAHRGQYNSDLYHV